jgi:hypothetical protein
MVEGSGTTEGLVVAKQVALGEHKELATWRFPIVIPVEVSALLKTKNNQPAVTFPVASRQIVSVPTPPQALPTKSEPMLTSLTAVLPMTFYVAGEPNDGATNSDGVPRFHLNVNADGSA